MENRFQEALNNVCKNCEKLINSIPVETKPNETYDIHHCGYQMCPFRTISNDYCKEIEILQELVDKETPKKPKLTIHNCFCPNCKEAFGKKRIEEESLSGFKWFQYCPYCGQLLDWSENGK